MEVKEFNKIFKWFIDYYGKENMTYEKMNIYYLGLKDIEKKQLEKAFIEIIRSRKSREIPMIAEIREYVLKAFKVKAYITKEI